MGEFGTGSFLSRTGELMSMDDLSGFAREWQVRDDEPMLFQFIEYPQYPTECVMPEASTESQRRLGESTQILRMAEEACAIWTGSAKEACIADVVATGDVDMAAAGAF
jgi:hypothetical protein